MNYEIRTIERAGFVGRIFYDDESGMPDFDGDGHTFSVWARGHYGYTVNVENTDGCIDAAEATGVAAGLTDALNRWGLDWDKIERYLRAYYDVACFDRTDFGSRGEATLVGVATNRLREAWGNPDGTISLDAWRAYRDGDVYYYDVTDEAGELVESCGGIYGYDYVEQQVNDVIDAAIAERHAARADMYRRLVNA